MIAVDLIPAVGSQAVPTRERERGRGRGREQCFAAITYRLTRTLSASCCQTSAILVLLFGTDGINITAESGFRCHRHGVLAVTDSRHTTLCSHVRNPPSAWHSGSLRMSAGLLVNTTLYSVLAFSYMQHYLHGRFRAQSAAYQASGCLSLQGGVVDVNAAVRLENMSRHIMPNLHRASTGTTE